MSQAPVPNAGTKRANESESIILYSYPKLVFLYPSLIMSLVTGVYLSLFTDAPLDPANRTAIFLNTLFLGVFTVNLVVLAFDFPRTTSLTLFFFAAAIVLGLVLLFTLKPEMMPIITGVLSRFRPLANATFYWTLTLILGVIFAVSFFTLRLDYWEVRPNELLHHHGVLSNLERFSAPNLRIDKEINDLFEYLLLRSGRLILHPSNERRAIILDNVPFIKDKERQITQLLGALKVDIRDDDEDAH
jgi:hypothetical protein